MSSHRRGPADRLREAVEALDRSSELEVYLPQLLEHFGAEVESLGPRSFLLAQSSGLRVEALPGFRRGEIAATCHRGQALEREDLEFLSWEHPVVKGAMELLTGSDHGNAAAAIWPGAPFDGWLAEAVFVVECVAPPRLFVDRFLPPTPVHVIVDHGLREASDELRATLRAARLAEGHADALGRDPELVERAQRMIGRGREIARDRISSIVDGAAELARSTLDREVDRLVALSEVNDQISKRELELARMERERMLEVIRGARPRLDSVRLVWLQRAPQAGHDS
jgi:ATP-dependent helicase HepA